MRVPFVAWALVLGVAVAIPTVTYVKFTRQRREPTTRQGLLILVLSLAVVAAIFGLIRLDDQAQT